MTNARQEIREVAVTLPPEDIFYVSWTFDAYEGIGFVRTDQREQRDQANRANQAKDLKLGHATVFCPEETLGEVCALLDALACEGVALEYTVTKKGQDGAE